MRRAKGDLTARQKAVLGYLVEYDSVWHHGPTLEEIAEVMGYRTTGTVSHHLHVLESRGFIDRVKGKPRSIRVLERPNGPIPDPPPPNTPDRATGPIRPGRNGAAKTDESWVAAKANSMVVEELKAANARVERLVALCQELRERLLIVGKTATKLAAEVVIGPD